MSSSSVLCSFKLDEDGSFVFSVKAPVCTCEKCKFESAGQPVDLARRQSDAWDLKTVEFWVDFDAPLGWYQLNICSGEDDEKPTYLCASCHKQLQAHISANFNLYQSWWLKHGKLMDQ